MIARILALVSLTALAACREKAPEQPARPLNPVGQVEFFEPQDGATVGPDVQVKLRAQGFIVEASTGERVAARGHHHILIDRDVAWDQPLPKEAEGIIHLDDGTEEYVITGLEPGKHRLIAVAAYGEEVPMERVSADTVNILVKAQ